LKISSQSLSDGCRAPPFSQGSGIFISEATRVTHQIRALEESLSVPLFDRTGKEVTLTPAGEILLKYVKRVDALLARAKEELSSLSGEVRGELRIAASVTIAQFVLPRIQGEFVRRHPSVQLAIASSKT
jgi:DNA-binding transcriptional LysR family regulator